MYVAVFLPLHQMQGQSLLSFDRSMRLLLFIFVVCVGCQTNVAYWPNKNTPVLNDSLVHSYKEIKIQTKDHLEFTHWYAKKGRLIVVVFHSNAGNIQHRWYKFFNKKSTNRIDKYNFLLSAGHSVLIASYRGYGSNPGTPSENKIIEDSQLILKHLIQNEQFSPKDIILFGESLGSAVAIALAMSYPVRGLILEGAPPSFPEVGKDLFPFLPFESLLKGNTWNSKLRIQSVRSPVFFMHRKKDYMVSYRLGQKLFESAKEPKYFLTCSGVGHINTLKNPYARKSVLQFIAEPQTFLNP